MEILISDLYYSQANGDIVEYVDDEIFKINDEHKTKINDIIGTFKMEINKIICSENVIVERFNNIPVKNSVYKLHDTCGANKLHALSDDPDFDKHSEFDYECTCNITQFCVNGDELTIEIAILNNPGYSLTYYYFITIPKLGYRLDFIIDKTHIYWGIYCINHNMSISADYTGHVKKHILFNNILDTDIKNITLSAINIITDIINKPTSVFKPKVNACFGVFKSDRPLGSD